MYREGQSGPGIRTPTTRLRTWQAANYLIPEWTRPESNRRMPRRLRMWLRRSLSLARPPAVYRGSQVGPPGIEPGLLRPERRALPDYATARSPAPGSRTQNLPLLKRTPLPVGLERVDSHRPLQRVSAWRACRGGRNRPARAICPDWSRAASASARERLPHYLRRASGGAWTDHESPLGGEWFEWSGRRLAARPETACETEQRVEKFNHSPRAYQIPSPSTSKASPSSESSSSSPTRMS